MNPPIYADTSALAKLFLLEREGPALNGFLRSNEFTLVSSELIEVELIRTISKVDSSSIPRAWELLGSMVLLPISGSVRKIAGELLPGKLRSLDAIHLSTALEIKADLTGLLTYDNRMVEMATESGIEVLSPK